MKIAQVDACHLTLLEIQELLTKSIRRRNEHVRNVMKSIAWTMNIKNKAKSLITELEQHKSTFQVTLSLDIW